MQFFLIFSRVFYVKMIYFQFYLFRNLKVIKLQNSTKSTEKHVKVKSHLTEMKCLNKKMFKHDSLDLFLQKNKNLAKSIFN